MKPILAAATVLAALTAVPLTSSPAAAGEPTCRGQSATHVGTLGEDLTTSPGADVVVTNGARRVETRDGDDVICVTRDAPHRVTVVPGAGDDLVDSTRYDGWGLRTYLGVLHETGSSGDDTYVGGDAPDRVLVFSGTAEDHKVVSGEGDEDVLKIGSPYAGTVAADLGPGTDDYFANELHAGVDVEGGPGRDFLLTDCPGCTSAGFDLGTGAVTVDGAAAGTAAGFQSLSLFRRRLEELTVVGDAGFNSVTAVACTADVRGNGGGDVLVVHPAGSAVCATPSATIRGGRGNDLLRGTPGDDLLVGGPGTDSAYGEAGVDVCGAERRRGCEG